MSLNTINLMISMRGEVVAIVTVVVILLGAGAGYLAGNAKERTVTSVSTYTTTSVATTTSITTDVLTNTNESALLRQEVTLLGQIGGEGVSAFAVNSTWTIEPNQTVLVDQEVNQYNGSLVFIGYACPDGAGSSSNANGEQGITILLDSKSLIPSKSMNIEPVGPQEWAVYLKNIGLTIVQCTGSLYYVYQVPKSP